MKPKTKLCLLCKKEINLDKDDYVKLTDYFNGKRHSEGFYHNKCYQDRLRGGNTMQKMAATLYERTNQLLNKVDGEEKKEVVYDIK